MSKHNVIFINTRVKTSRLAQKILSREDWQEKEVYTAAATESSQIQPVK